MASEEEHHLGLGAYLLTWLGLLALTGLTFGLSFLGLGVWEMPTALLIATGKSLLVALFFMHLLEQGATVRLIAVIGLAFSSLLCGLTMLDEALRTDDDVKDVKQVRGASERPRRAPAP